MILEGKKKSFFGRLSDKISEVFLGRKVDENLLEELEEVLITSDIGMNTTIKIIDNLREDVRKNGLNTEDAVKARIKEIVFEILDKGDRHKLSEKRPLVILLLGINGGGKTTSAGKLAAGFKNRGESVLLAAADTFRAAASEQLELWGKRAGVNVIRHSEGADPSAVIYDALQSAKAKSIDVLICDTAGRLQNKKNLMAELEKMNRIIDREFPDSERETLLVLDATTGKNAVSQAEEFGNAAGITGIILTKLDGTAKGGITITIADEFDLPVKFVGVGEGIDDLIEFDPKEFAGGLFNE